jgi:biopolymer transport protein TolR
MPKVQQSAGHGAGTSRGKRGRGARVGTSLAEINVVPLVDVMLVLLIIFMVAAPMMTQGMPVNLPKAAASRNIPAQQIFVTVPVSFATDRRVQLDSEWIGIDALPERVKQRLMERTDRSLFLRGDGAVAFKDIVTVFDKLKSAGIEKVGVVTTPVGSK